MSRWYTRPIVPVADVTVALAWYEALGFAEDWRHEDSKLLIAQVSRDGCELILSCQWPDKVGKAMQFLSLELDVLTAFRADIEHRGIATKEGWWGYPLLILTDPDGNELLFAYSAEEIAKADG